MDSSLPRVDPADSWRRCSPVISSKATPPPLSYVRNKSDSHLTTRTRWIHLSSVTFKSITTCAVRSQAKSFKFPSLDVFLNLTKQLWWSDLIRLEFAIVLFNINLEKFFALFAFFSIEHFCAKKILSELIVQICFYARDSSSETVLLPHIRKEKILCKKSNIYNFDYAFSKTKITLVLQSTGR